MGWVVNATPRPLYPPGKTRYPLYRRLDGPQGRSGRVRNISPPPGFDPRTVQPVASRYTDWGTPAHILPYCSTTSYIYIYIFFFYAITGFRRSINDIALTGFSQCRMVIHCRRFETTHRSHMQWLVRNYHSVLRETSNSGKNRYILSKRDLCV